MHSRQAGSSKALPAPQPTDKRRSPSAAAAAVDTYPTKRELRAAAQRSLLARWGSPHWMCPFPPADCLIHRLNDASHVPVARWTAAQAVAYRDVIWPKILQPTTTLNKAERTAFSDLLDAVVRVKQTGALSESARPLRLDLQRAAPSVGFVAVVEQIHDVVGARGGNAAPEMPGCPASKKRSSPVGQPESAAPSGSSSRPRAAASDQPVPGSWSLQQAVSFRTTWPDAALRVGMSGTQTAFVDALLDAAVMRLSAGSPPPQARKSGSAQKAAKPPPSLRGCSDPEGLCPYMLCCTAPHHTTSHAPPEEWTPAQAVAFRDRIWPVFKQNREGMSDAQVGFVTSLLEVLTGRASAAPSSHADTTTDALVKAREDLRTSIEENRQLSERLATLEAEVRELRKDRDGLAARRRTLEAELRASHAHHAADAALKMQDHATEGSPRWIRVLLLLVAAWLLLLVAAVAGATG